MAAFSVLSLSKSQTKAELLDFKALLNDPIKSDLSEANDIIPFFKNHPQLCALMGTYNSNIIIHKSISFACEFDIFGDHVADLAVGDTSNHEYCFVEFENANAHSIFKKSPKLTPEWSPRYERGFSQLVDWILWLENAKGTTAFKQRFNTDIIRYNMLLVIGRDAYIANRGLRDRMNWRTDQVVIASRKFNCVTFDKLYEDLRRRAMHFKD